MRHVTFFHKDTGMLHSLSVMVSDETAVKMNTPPDHVAIDHPRGERLDRLCQRVDVTTGSVVSYQPPRPTEEHEWNGRRWQISAAAKAREHLREVARAEIIALEISQARAVREAILGGGVDKLREIDSRITELRKVLSPS